MAVIAHVVVEDVTPEQYDAVREHAGWLRTPPDGGLAHLTWWQGADCYNVDAWESEEAFGTFVETRLAPAMAAVGVTSEPKVAFHAAHEVFLPTALTRTRTPVG